LAGADQLAHVRLEPGAEDVVERVDAPEYEDGRGDGRGRLHAQPLHPHRVHPLVAEPERLGSQHGQRQAQQRARHGLIEKPRVGAGCGSAHAMEPVEDGPGASLGNTRRARSPACRSMSAWITIDGHSEPVTSTTSVRNAPANVVMTTPRQPWYAWQRPKTSACAAGATGNGSSRPATQAR